MQALLDHPIILSILSAGVLWLSSRIGLFLQRRRRKVEDDERQDVSTMLASTLTLLGLLIGFTFSMAVSRYDNRKQQEAEEANAIGTEYVRTDLLPVAADGARVRELLRSYVDKRVRLYQTRDGAEMKTLDHETDQLEVDMWAVVSRQATATATPIMALVVAGMNDVLNARGHAEAAERNRIPVAAWSLMFAIAFFCNVLFGYSTHKQSFYLFWVLPIALSISFLLIADIDSPRGGLIRVGPQDLHALAESLHP